MRGWRKVGFVVMVGYLSPDCELLEPYMNQVSLLQVSLRSLSCSTERVPMHVVLSVLRFALSFLMEQTISY